jgi:hypothetical protein
MRQSAGASPKAQVLLDRLNATIATLQNNKQLNIWMASYLKQQ